MIHVKCTVNFGKHFKKIAELNRRYITLDNISKEEKDYILKVQECWISSEKENPNNGFLFNGKLIDTTLKRNDIRFLLSKGFSNFKIEGRGLGSALILEFLLYYMTKPEYQLHVREKIYLDNTLDLF